MVSAPSAARTEPAADRRIEIVPPCRLEPRGESAGHCPDPSLPRRRTPPPRAWSRRAVRAEEDGFGLCRIHHDRDDHLGVLGRLRGG